MALSLDVICQMIEPGDISPRLMERPKRAQGEKTRVGHGRPLHSLSAGHRVAKERGGVMKSQGNNCVESSVYIRTPKKIMQS